MRRALCPSLWVSWLAAGLFGCSGGPIAPPEAPKPPVSDLGRDYYADARKVWVDARARDLRGEPWRASASRAASLLEHAIASDPQSALYLTKLAELLIQLGPDQLARADDLLNQAHAISPYWPDFWLAKCEASLARNDPAAAEQALAGARAAIDELSLGAADRRTSRTSAAARGQLVAWLAESGRWTPDGSNLTLTSTEGAAALQWARAREAYYQFQLLAANAAPAGALDVALRKVLALQPDFIPARVTLAKLLLLRGQYQEAEAQLAGYVRTNNRLLSNNGELQLRLAEVYKDWYVRGGKGQAQFDGARLLYEVVIMKHQDDVRATLGLAELIAAREGKRPAPGLNASALLTRARQLGADNADAPPDVREAYARVQEIVDASR
jgi:hypothetical protein